jgi:hypothetical protein
MKSIRLVLFFTFLVVAIPSFANCLTCQKNGPGQLPECQPTDFAGQCSRSCCGQLQGTSCPQPDFYDDCSVLLVAKSAANTYFTTRRLIETRSVTLWSKMGATVTEPKRADCSMRTLLEA